MSPIRCPFLILLAGLAVTARVSATTWTDALLTTTGDGISLASAVGPNGYTHMAWTAGSPNSWNYAYQDVSGFHTVTFTAAQVATKLGISPLSIRTDFYGFLTPTSIAIDSNNVPHVSFSAGKSGLPASNERGVFYATYNGGTITDIANWTFSRVATYTHSGGFRDAYVTAIAIDASVNRPVIAWSLSDTAASPRTSTLQYVRRNADGSWPAGSAASSTATSTGATVAFQYSGNPDAFGNLSFAFDGNGKRHFTLTIDPDGGASLTRLVYGTDASGSWVTTELVNGGSSHAVTAAALAIDSSNRPRVAWTDYRDKKVNVEAFDGTSWNRSTVATRAASPWSNKIGFALGGAIELVAFADNSGGTYTVKTAARSGGTGSWTVETGASSTTANLGYELAATVLSGGAAVVSYHANPLDDSTESVRRLTGTISFVAPDTTPPTITSIARLTPSTQTITNGTTSLTFRVTYSEAVQGVTTAQFSVEAVNGSSIAGTIASVSGTGTTRDVTVNITGGHGEFRLKPID